MMAIASFLRDRNGSAAQLFCLALLPMMAAVGAGVDFWRASQVRDEMHVAVTATALAIARDGAKLGVPETAELGRRVFDQHFEPRGDVAVKAFSVTRGDRNVSVAITGQVKTAVMDIVGLQAIDIAAQAQIGWGKNKIELALVLDNSASMGQAGKMAALKRAAGGLIDVLESQAPERDAFKVAIVPFTGQVNVGATATAGDWLVFNAAGLDPRVAVDPSAWAGCVADRDRPYDTDASLRILGSSKTLYPAAKCSQSELALLQPLTGDFPVSRSALDAMRAAGNTNITIGLAWGLASLTPGAPLSPAQPFAVATLTKMMIVVAGGDNSQNRFTADPVEIDRRTDKACREVKRNGVRVYAIRLTGGNARLLSECASSPSMYYEVKDAGELDAVFQTIAQEIVTERLTQ